jgi:hypothetical protein
MTHPSPTISPLRVNIYKKKFIAQSSPQRLKLSFPVTDTYGNEIQQFQQGQFTIQLLTRFEDGTTTLGDLGVLKIGPDYVYTFMPATPTQGTTYVSFDTDPTINILRQLHANENLLAQGFRQLALTPHKGALSVLLNYVDQCPCSDKAAVDQSEKQAIFRSLGVFFDGSQELVTKVAQGLLTLADPTKNPVKADNLTDSASNVESSIKEIARLIELVRKYMTHNPSAETEMRSLLSYLHDFQHNIIRHKSVLSDIIKKRDLLKENFANRFNLMVAQELFSGSTSTLNMVSDAKLRIIPEIGFVALFNNDKWYSYQDFAPYLGFQIGFRPIDKNIPFRLIRDKSIWHFLTFKAGITLTSLEIEGQRTDFFGKNSLMTGMGIRLGRFFSISPGVIWCKAVDPSPLSSGKITQASPSLALSADFELRDLFEGFNRLFK